MEQLQLWEDSTHKGRRLQEALDDVRTRFGRDAIQRAIEIEIEPHQDADADD